LERFKKYHLTHAKVGVCVLIGLLVFGFLPKATADSGGPIVYTFGDHIDTNESMYSLYYATPAVIQAGVKTNLTFYIYITELSGWKINNQRQILTININTPAATVTTLKVNRTGFTYQGSRWGPFNMTVDITPAQAGLSPGQTTNATLYANLVVYEQYNDPKFPILAPDGKTLQVTNQLQISDPAPSTALSALTGNHLLTSIAIGAVVVIALIGVTLLTRKRGGQGTFG
jgi:hypothetical protein